MIFFYAVCLIIIIASGILGFAVDYYDKVQRDRRYSRIDFLRKHPNYYEGEDGKVYKRQ